MYRVTQEESLAQREDWKKQYPPFKPYTLTETNKLKVGNFYQNLISTQNGQDTDDYTIHDNNKTERYLAHYPKGNLLLLGVGTGREIVVAKDIGFKAKGITLGTRNIGTFDIVAGFQVFEHALSPLLFLLEQRRVLKIGGSLILEWPPANDRFTGGANPHHQVCYTPGQAKALFQKAGFENIDLLYDNLLPIPETEYWKGEQDKMLLIRGTKSQANHEYLRRNDNG